MGVHGLWELLAPVGRRVSVETLAGKTLAIDASIWMVRFMKAMRDDKGEIVRNAHLIGFFSRICKLLFLRTKPVFVFDGATPALKRRTVIARRKHRENAQAKIRKTAEKLLLNHLKAMKLKELANDIRMQRQLNDAKGKKVLSEDKTENEEKHKSSGLSSRDQVKMDEMLSASIAAEEEQELNMAALTSDEDVDIVLPETLDDIDPAVLDALPPGLREQIEKLSSKDTRDSPHIEKKVSFSNSQLEMKDCGMASPIAAEEGGSSMYTASTSLAHSFSEDYENDSDEEMIVPELFEAVDKEVLNSLPISVRLDLFTQMKERQMAENRQIYQQLKKAPEKFSELQIQSYLKAVALRREINQVQKASVRRGVGGVQTSRIASEANREFIFSSSYVGNKELLTSSNQSNINGKEPQTHLDISSSIVVSEGRSRETSSPVTGLLSSKKKSVFDGSVQTFLDERGRIRVSRVRAMGIRMTRDLQRNLDLMKEIEQDEANVNSQSSNLANAESIGNIDVTGPTRNGTIDDTLSGHNDKSASLKKGTPSLKFGNATPIQISFEDGGDSMTMDDDDDIFTQLVVAGESASLSVDKTSSSILYSHLDPYSLQHKTNRDSFLNNSEVEADQRGDPNSSDDSEVDWEEGCDTPVTAQRSEPKKSASRGVLEEDADLREAIRRSLEDQMCEVASGGDQQSKADVEISHEIAASSDLENDDVKQILSNRVAKSFGTHADVMDDASTNDSSHGNYVSQVTDFSLEREEHCKSYESINLNADKPCKIYQNSHSEILLEDGGNIQDQRRGELSGGRIVALETDKGNLEEGKVVGMYSFRIASSDEGNSRDSVPLTAGVSLRPVIEIDDKGCKADFTASPPAIEEMNCDASGKLLGSTESKYPTAEDMVQNYNEEGLEKGWNEVVNSPDDKQAAFTRANLEEEIQKLGKECVNLGKEQKKLERNADLVTSEMFVECQELLHMFGIPYLIAPMEAEAQCAFMELENLVDGVVTDDSDVLLFGAKSVYKNIFDDRKYVEMYLLKDIEKELGLTREKLISMALLLGSDYTEGVSGIGIVNAIEVVNAFPEEDGGLQKFREWVELPDPAILGKVDLPARSTPKKRGLRASGSEMKSQRDLSAESLAQEENRPDETEEMKQKFMNTHRNVSKNWHFPPSFPSEAVISAYSSPQVDRSTDPFSWGRPDLFLLRKLCWEKFGWGNQKADELLTPVLNEYSKHETQLRLEAFYSFNEMFAKIRSKRIKKAVKGITKGKSSVLMDETRRAVPGHGSMGSSFQEHRDEISEDVSGRGKESCSASHSNTLENRTSMQSRKRKAKGKCNLSETGNGSAYKLSVLKQQIGKRARGKGRKIADTRKKKVDEYSDESESEGNSGSGESDHNPSNSKAEDLEGHKQVRRSGRHRKEVDYTVDSSKDELMECGSNVHQDDETAPGNNQFSTDKRDDLPVTFETLVQEVASCDYLKTGGGFCVDEDDTDQTHNSRDISNEDDFSQDTHCMDGSFFLNETEAVGEPKSHRTNQAEGAARPVPVQEVSSAVPDGTECQREGSQPQCETDSGDTKTRHDSGSNMLLEGSRGNDNPPLASYGSLRAMPILRRKRRKT